MIFLIIQQHWHFWAKSHHTRLFWCKVFLNLTIWKPTAHAFQNTLTFDRYLFNSRSNFHVNLVHWNSLHPKMAILPTFLGQTPHFLCENHKTRTNNLHHWKAGSVSVILSLKVGVQHITKKWCKMFYTTVTVECTWYHARPRNAILISFL